VHVAIMCNHAEALATSHSHECNKETEG